MNAEAYRLKKLLIQMPVREWRADKVLRPYVVEAVNFLIDTPSGVFGHDATAVKDIASMLVINKVRDE